jgi:[amino group carrier protein]-6-phospho-L-2-aminoadipate/5-phospho-L-glutamate reductase
MKIDAVILGASGYGGGELLYWLSRHPDVHTVRGTSRKLNGKSFSTAHPHLRSIVGGSFESEIDWQDLARSEQPVVFSALPHGELASQLSGLEAAWLNVGISGRLVLVDLSADFRVPSPRAFQQLNGFEHPCPELLSRFVYGLPEWNGTAIREAKRIASPGCFATALQLALLPLRGSQIDFLAASAVTGSSGSGASPTFGTHHPSRANDFRAYKILTHHHIVEVEMAMAACNIKGKLGFVPHSGPFVRGIFATLQFQNADGLHLSALNHRVATAFDHCPFIRIVEGSPRVAAVAGSNFADVGVAGNENTSVIMIAIDNLGKGMAGQAVQAMNVSLGLLETTALWQPARVPS